MTDSPKLDARVLPRDRRTIATRLHLLERQGEWWSAVFMISCAIVLAIPGNAFGYPAWSAFHEHGLTKAIWTGLFAAVGVGRVVALIVNGYLQLVTPSVRLTASLAGLAMWTVCFLLLLQGTPAHDGVFTLVVPLIAVLAVKEIFNCYLAAIDVRIQS